MGAHLKKSRLLVMILSVLMILTLFSVPQAKAGGNDYTFDITGLNTGLSTTEVNYLKQWFKEAKQEGVVDYYISDSGDIYYINMNPFAYYDNITTDLSLNLKTKQLGTYYECDITSCTMTMRLQNGSLSGDTVSFVFPNWSCTSASGEHELTYYKDTPIVLKRAYIEDWSTFGQILEYTICPYCYKLHFDIRNYQSSTFMTGVLVDPDEDYAYDSGEFDYQVYTGSRIEPFFMFGEDGSYSTYDEFTDGYIATWKNNKNVGTATLTVTFPDDHKYYIGSLTRTFRILPKGTKIAKLTSRSKAIIVTWKKQSEKMSKSRITGYQIQIATNKKFTKNKKTYTITGYKNVSKKVKKLKAGQKYYVRVRTYKDTGSDRYHSLWSKAKTIKAGY